MGRSSIPSLHAGSARTANSSTLVVTTEADLPRWFNNGRKKINKDSEKMERRHAKRIGGRRQAGSGSSWRAPQDVVGPVYLDQLKFRTGSIRITADEWRAIRDDALKAGREPRFIIELRSGNERINLAVTEFEADPD